MESMEDKFPENSPRKAHKSVLVAQIFLRLFASATALAAALVMITSKQTIIMFGIPFDAKYSYTPAFMFFAYANAIACAFTVLSLLVLFNLARHGLTPPNFFLLFLLDLFMLSLVLSGVSAGTAVGFIGQNGNIHAGWLKICDRLGIYCRKVTTSMIFSYLSVICLLILTIISASKSRQIKV